MSSTASPSAPVIAVTAFPAASVVSTLRGELIDAVKAEAGMRGTALPASLANLTKVAFGIDSLLVVSLLCAVESTVGMELPESIVRSGGYRSVDDALDQLLPKIEALWFKAHSK